MFALEGIRNQAGLAKWTTSNTSNISVRRAEISTLTNIDDLRSTNELGASYAFISSVASLPTI